MTNEVKKMLNDNLKIVYESLKLGGLPKTYEFCIFAIMKKDLTSDQAPPLKTSRNTPRKKANSRYGTNRIVKNNLVGLFPSSFFFFLKF